jgi:hypothetical protein
MVLLLTGGKEKLIKCKVMPYNNEKKSGVQMSPYKKYGTEEKAVPMMMGMPSVLKMCGSKRHVGKKK